MRGEDRIIVYTVVMFHKLSFISKLSWKALGSYVPGYKSAFEQALLQELAPFAKYSYLHFQHGRENTFSTCVDLGNSEFQTIEV